MTLTEEEIQELKYEKYTEYQREAEQDRYYEQLNDWISDNKVELMEEYCEENSDSFKDYCKQAFKDTPTYDECHPQRPR